MSKRGGALKEEEEAQCGESTNSLASPPFNSAAHSGGRAPERIAMPLGAWWNAAAAARSHGHVIRSHD